MRGNACPAACRRVLTASTLPPAPVENVLADSAHESECDALLDDVGDANAELVTAELVTCAAQPHPYDVYETWKLAAKFAPLWIAANWSFNTSLCGSCGTGTSVSSNALLSSSSGAFTILFSIIFLGDKFSWAKLGWVIVSMTGVSLLVNFDNTRPHQAQNLWGDLFAFAAAAFMGGYSVQLKCMLGGEGEGGGGRGGGVPNVSMPMFFGFLGVTAALLGLPLFVAAIVLGFRGWAHLEILGNLDLKTFGALTFNGLVGTVLSDLLWAKVSRVHLECISWYLARVSRGTCV